jgi:hypothetical protein
MPVLSLAAKPIPSTFTLVSTDALHMAHCARTLPEFSITKIQERATYLIKLLHIFFISVSIVRTDHQVNNNSGHRNIQPNWKCIFHNFSVLLQLVGHGKINGGQHQRNHDKCQQDVCDEEKEIDNLNDALATKLCRFSIGVINDVKDEKYRPQYECTNYASFVKLHLALLDKIHT